VSVLVIFWYAEQCVRPLLLPRIYLSCMNESTTLLVIIQTVVSGNPFLCHRELPSRETIGNKP